jgi:parvulin-like peptidyl-prolyl isomerase
LNSNDEETPKEVQQLQKGQSVVVRSDGNTYHYKLLETSQGKEFRVGYIYLNGKELQKPQVDMFRSLIIERYEKGTSFKDLADTYNMDQNSKSEDLGWFKEGRMVPQFENAIRAHQKGDIFTVDVDDRKWYYVVLKTYEDRIVDYLTFVKVQEQ